MMQQKEHCGNVEGHCKQHQHCNNIAAIQALKQALRQYAEALQQHRHCCNVLSRDVPGKEREKRERERNGKGMHSFLSRSSIFGHPFFFPFLAKIMKNG